MMPNKYQKEALRTESPIPWMRANDSTFRLLQGLMGLNGEAGEAIDILKKHLFQGHDLDREHLVKELGDVAWYLAVSADPSDEHRQAACEVSGRVRGGTECEQEG